MTTPKGTILVTGANGGLGSAIVESIASRPDLAAYHGVYTVRDVAKAGPLQSALQATKFHSHEVMSLNLSELSSVREASATINAKVSAGEIPRIRALVLNAGHRDPQGQTRTKGGLDTAFASNYLGHWLLVLPLDKINEVSGAFEEEEWKKIFADASSGTVESVVKGTWSPSPDDTSKDPRGLSGIRRYGASKLCIIMMILELQRRLDSDPELSGISVLGVDPGLMPTKITTDTLSWPTRSLIFIMAHISSRISPNGMMRLPRKSAGDVLAAAFKTDPPFGERPKGLYFNGSEPKEVSVEAKDAEKRAAVWKASVDYAELKEGETRLVHWA
ncbi:hypothetical protein DL764_009794 [Monosporascus ibericus]|uniref:3beta-hydroxysteroid 3-dehydrogenase n=1 Tax=Monosporascus ibericus TaxID=155417 RepID=A0A4Q4SU31_9PEZI|nr:hypothetical protein DL764_009794 [Monosporascus ibericus]